MLVIDDDPDTRTLITAMLAQRGHHVVTAADGRTGLERAGVADLVLLDVMLPDMDGWSICRTLKARDAGLPVIMVTARAGRDDLVRTFEAGADDYIAKPFHEGELVARVGSRLAARRNEEELRLALERYELAGRASSEVLWEWDVARGTVTWSEGLPLVFGHALTAVTCRLDWWLEQVHPAHRERVRRTLDEALESADGAWLEEYRFRRGDGRWADVADRGFVARPDGRSVRMIGSMLDISARKRMEGTLRYLSEASAVLANSLDPAQTLAGVAHVSPGFLGDVALALQDEGQGTFRVAAAAHGDPARQAALQAVADTLEVACDDGSGALASALRAGEPALLSGPACADLAALELTSLIVLPLSVGTRTDAALVFGATAASPPLEAADLDVARELARRTALALDKARLYSGVESAERRYRLLFEKNPQALLVWDVETRGILAANAAALALYGYQRDRLMALSINDLRPPEELPQLDAALDGAEADTGRQMRAVHRRADGTTLEVEVVSNPLEFEGRAARLVLVVDVSERVRSELALRETEEQLRQAQKMEAIGKLAGGVAHDFNNILTAIQGHARLLLTQMEDSGALADVVEIDRAAERAASLTRQLLAFGRRQVLQPRVLDLNETVGDLDRMLRRIIGEHVLMETSLDPDLPHVRVDPGQMEQVLVNLMVNAKDAMPGGGHLRISTRREVVAARDGVEGLQPGEHVILEVRDSGHGMAPEVHARIFEPFFTTKPVGKGTGLGLATVYGIVRQTGGAVTVRSEPGEGATFQVYLPAVEAPSAPQPDTAEPDADTAGHGAGRVILVVEDEPVVRQLARRVLEREGYTVLDAANAAAALEMADGFAGRIHLLLSDVVMPGMGGPALARELVGRRPETGVLFMSGYAEDEIVDHGVLLPGVDFLPKPFGPRELAQRVLAAVRAADPPRATR